MPQNPIIARVDNLPLSRFANMLAESKASGYQFLRRVLDGWESAVNRFSPPGEALLLAQKSHDATVCCPDVHSSLPQTSSTAKSPGTLITSHMCPGSHGQGP